MNRFEQWLFPATCVMTGNAAETVDLSAEILNKMTRPGTFCPLCAEKLSVSKVCGACLKNPPLTTRTQVGFYFDETVQQLIHDFKYHNQLHLSRLLAELMLQTLDIEAIEALIPVPLHTSRLLERGFNQSLELAKQLSILTGVPVLPYEVNRIKATSPQANLSAADRVRNLRNAFAVQGEGLAELKRIALVDDVITTGITMQQLAKALKASFPGLEIEAWAIAKVLAK